MLGSPSGAVLERVLPGLSGSAAPPALLILRQFDPLQVNSRKGVASRIGRRCVSALLGASGGLPEAFGVESVVLDSGERPLVGLLPFLVTYALLEVGQG